MSLTIHGRVLGLFSRKVRRTRRQVLEAMRQTYLQKYAEDPFEGTLFDTAVMMALNQLAERFGDTPDAPGVGGAESRRRPVRNADRAVAPPP